MIERHAGGSLPPVGAIPSSKPSGPTGRSSASDSRPTNGMSWPGSDSLTFLPTIVESRTATMSSLP